MTAGFFNSVSLILYTHRSSSAGEREERMQRNFGVLKQSIWLPHWDTGTLFHPAWHFLIQIMFYAWPLLGHRDEIQGFFVDTRTLCACVCVCRVCKPPACRFFSIVSHSATASGPPGMMWCYYKRGSLRMWLKYKLTFSTICRLPAMTTLDVRGNQWRVRIRFNQYRTRANTLIHFSFFSCKSSRTDSLSLALSPSLWDLIFTLNHRHTQSLCFSRSLILRFTTPLKIKVPLFLPHSDLQRMALFFALSHLTLLSNSLYKGLRTSIYKWWYHPLSCGWNVTLPQLIHRKPQWAAPGF